MCGALFEAKHADKFEGRNYVAGVHHRKARFIGVEGFGASFGQKQFTAEHDVEIGAFQQARELFLRNRVTAEQKQFASGWPRSAPSSRRSVHCGGCSSCSFYRLKWTLLDPRRFRTC